MSNIGLLRKEIRKELQEDIQSLDELTKKIFLEHDETVSKYLEN